MGMFDTVFFKCPKCQEEIEEQSKAGDCLLRRYHHTSVPPNIAMNLVNEKITCHNCHETFTISSKEISRVNLFLISESDNNYD